MGRLLHKLKEGGHRVLLFTQMTKVLDVLESFMNFQGHTYLRLDGSTKIEQRQILMERFNANSKYFCFILSTRSGGVGVNLTGADTVIFYDSDWNPTMDAQAQVCYSLVINLAKFSKVCNALIFHEVKFSPFPDLFKLLILYERFIFSINSGDFTSLTKCKALITEMCGSKP